MAVENEDCGYCVIEFRANGDLLRSSGRKSTSAASAAVGIDPSQNLEASPNFLNNSGTFSL